MIKQYRKSSHFMEPEESLKTSKHPKNFPYPKPHLSNPNNPTVSLISFLILSSYLSLDLVIDFFPHQNPVGTSPSTHTCYMLPPSHCSWLSQPNNICCRTQVLNVFQMHFLQYPDTNIAPPPNPLRPTPNRRRFSASKKRYNQI